MIDKLKFKNYKAFDEGEIEIRPLTFLLGANSSGKSSILHLFLMLEQTISNTDNYNAALKTNGHSVSLGEDENLLKDRKHEKQIHLEFGINAKDYIDSVKEMQHKILSHFSYLINVLNNSEDSAIQKYNKRSKERKIISLEGLFALKKFGTSKASKILDNLYSPWLLESLNSTSLNNDITFLKWIEWMRKSDSKIFVAFYESIKNCFDLFNKAFDSSPDSASIEFVLEYNDPFRKLTVTNCKVIVGEKMVIQILIKGEEIDISSKVFASEDLKTLTNYTSELSFEFNSLSIRSLSTLDNPFITYIVTLVKQAFMPVQDFFSKKNMNYVGPLRANPQRYYFLDDSNTNTTLDYRKGASLAEILKNNKSVLKKINKWLNRFDLNVNVEEFRDIIHNIKVKQNMLSLDIPDVGFGVSQLLPILVEGMMSSENSTIIMEQPEIHLHPKMQAELAEFFIDILQLQNKDNNQINKHLIIESHSEYIIKRIRRRLAEGKISREQVAIYFVTPRKYPDTAEIKLAPISDDGTIEWPEEFYITEFEDEMAFFKAKMNKS